MQNTGIAIAAIALASQYGMAIEAPAEFFKKGDVLACMACSTAMDTVDAVFENKLVQKILLDIGKVVCIALHLARTPWSYCPAIVPQMGEWLFPVVTTYFATRDKVCDEWLGFCTQPVYQEIDLNMVIKEILSTKPLSIRDDNFVNNMYAQITADPNVRETYLAIHISDPHLDNLFTSGTVMNCPGYLCCHESDGFATKPGEIPAGYWGGYLCDIPTRTFRSMLEFIKTEIKPDMFFWTGDNSSHNEGYNDIQEITEYTIQVSEEIKAAFADTNITVLPIQGNHDTFPLNIQDFSAPGINYPINHFKDSWKDWLTPEALETFGKYGYYSMPITLRNGKQMPRGSRVIGLNTQVCNMLNWFILGDRVDPGNHFEWLTQQLEQVEADGGLAIMIAHFNPNACQTQWGTRYRALMERFQHVVRYGLQGHTHDEDFMISMSITHPNKAVGLNSIGGSVTPYMNVNPSFAVVEFDAQTMLPVNMHTYYFDLDKANAESAQNPQNAPGWTYLHDWKETYGLKDLSPASMLELSERLRVDQDLAINYFWNKSRQMGQRPTNVDQHYLYCYTTSTEINQYQECLDQNKAPGFDFGGLTGKDIADFFIKNWIRIRD